MSGAKAHQFAGFRGFPQATHTLATWQKIFLATFFIVLGLCFYHNFYVTILTLNGCIMVFYLVSLIYRTLLIDLSLHQHREIEVSTRDITSPPSNGWPKYVILVPLYREAEILPDLIAALKQLDYPEDKLEIRLLIEEDDEETLHCAQNLDLPSCFTVFLIAPSEPRTKPKACNVALEDATGDYLVIFDAEDRPDPDQLKKAATAFTQVPANVACIQAKLNFYNPNYNFLTRCFTAEYATWFDLCLPGLDSLRALIPLGGTSNHFRLNVLKRLKGWDEFNVTEDCDLGLRLFYQGWRTRILNTTTWEQACPDAVFWLKQRSRWVKGYIQTYFVHLRHPFHLCRKLGVANSLHYHLLIGGTPFCQIVNPIYWGLTLFWFVSQNEIFSTFFPAPIFIMAAICLFVGNFLFAFTHSVACVRRGFGHLAKYGVVMPVYWGLMSAGAWKGFLQLITKPHYWEKTKHFLTDIKT